eukprot:5788175-Pyramimonas_sp.AAC.1
MTSTPRSRVVKWVRWCWVASSSVRRNVVRAPVRWRSDAGADDPANHHLGRPEVRLPWSSPSSHPSARLGSPIA